MTSETVGNLILTASPVACLIGGLVGAAVFGTVGVWVGGAVGLGLAVRLGLSRLA